MSFCKSSEVVLAASSVCLMCQSPVLSGVTCMSCGRLLEGIVLVAEDVWNSLLRVVLVMVLRPGLVRLMACIHS